MYLVRWVDAMGCRNTKYYALRERAEADAKRYGVEVMEIRGGKLVRTKKPPTTAR